MAKLHDSKEVWVWALEWTFHVSLWANFSFFCDFWEKSEKKKKPVLELLWKDIAHYFHIFSIFWCIFWICAVNAAGLVVYRKTKRRRITKKLDFLLKMLCECWGLKSYCITENAEMLNALLKKSWGKNAKNCTAVKPWHLKAEKTKFGDGLNSVFQCNKDLQVATRI